MTNQAANANLYQSGNYIAMQPTMLFRPRGMFSSQRCCGLRT